MNPLFRLMFGPYGSMAAMGDGRPDNKPGDLKALIQAYAEAKAAKQQQSPMPSSTPSVPISGPQAHEQTLPQPASPVPISGPQPAPPQAPSAGAIPFLNSPFGQVFPAGAPRPAPAAPAPASTAPQAVPLPAPRPAEAPQAAPQMSMFERNAAMMRDPGTGAFIDPTRAAMAQAQMGGPDLISKMMGYLNKGA